MGITASVPAFKAALKARLEALSALSTGATAVSWGNPHPDYWPAEVVIIGATSNYSQTPACALTQAREEYDVELTVNITGDAAEPNPDNQVRAWALMDAAAASILAWNLEGAPICSGAWGAVTQAMPGSGHDAEGLEGQSRDATVARTVHVTAALVSHGD